MSDLIWLYEQLSQQSTIVQQPNQKIPRHHLPICAFASSKAAFHKGDERAAVIAKRAVNIFEPIELFVHFRQTRLDAP